MLSTLVSNRISPVTCKEKVSTGYDSQKGKLCLCGHRNTAKPNIKKKIYIQHCSKILGAKTITRPEGKTGLCSEIH